MTVPAVTQGKYLQSIWPIMQEKQRKIQREATLAPRKADRSGEEWENSSWAPSGVRVVPAAAHRAEPQVLLATAAGAPVPYLWPLPPSRPF